jgi:hypothetical protein
MHTPLQWLLLAHTLYSLVRVSRRVGFSRHLWINVENKNSLIKHATITQLTLAHPMKQSNTEMKPGCRREYNNMPLSWLFIG